MVTIPSPPLDDSPAVVTTGMKKGPRSDLLISLMNLIIANAEIAKSELTEGPP